MQSSRLNLQVGRITIECLQDVAHVSFPIKQVPSYRLIYFSFFQHKLIFFNNFVQLPTQNRQFVDLRSSLHILERIACCVKYNEPILLVGETGTGKTTLVQNLATRLGKTLTVLVCLQIFGIILHMHSHLYCI